MGQFQFRKFTVSDDKATMKVGTDGVLLGAWTNVPSHGRILDVGTGCGLIALMLAQRTPQEVDIVALELQEQDAQQASDNVVRSPWSQRIVVLHKDAREYQSDVPCELIISNPPYFENSLKPPDPRRTAARHSETLTAGTLVEIAEKNLSATGTLAVIGPPDLYEALSALATQHGLYVQRKCTFQSRATKPVTRILAQLGRVRREPENQQLCLYNEGSEWSDDYSRLTTDFYLPR